MKRALKRGVLEYEKPQVTTILLKAEQGFAKSTQLEDMYETEGEWY